MAELVDGRTVLRRVRSQPPLVLRRTDRGLTLVTGAAGPLGGDRTTLTVTVGAGASLDVGSAGASLALPGVPADTSHAMTCLDVAADGSLGWRPEPLIVAAGADHIAEFQVDLAASARLALVETVVLGRHGEPPGRLRSRWRVRRAGATLLAQDLDVGVGASPGWDGGAVLGGARALATALLVEPGGLVHESPVAVPGAKVDVLPLTDPAAALIVVTGTDTVRVGRALAAALAACRVDVAVRG